jgi:hypothetical protein
MLGVGEWGFGEWGLGGRDCGLRVRSRETGVRIKVNDGLSHRSVF